MINCIVIDDEVVAHDILQEYCDKVEHITIQKHCYDALEAITFLNENDTDLIFLDINLPQIKGFQFLKTLIDPPLVIVTSAYDQYAMEGYDLDVVDYLLKPFGLERFLKAINKVTNLLNASKESTVLQDKQEGKRLFFYSDKKHVQVGEEDITHIEAFGNYTKIHLVDDDVLVVRGTFTETIKSLTPSAFIQVHRSFMLSIRHIKSIGKSFVEMPSCHVPVGESFKERVSEVVR